MNKKEHFRQRTFLNVLAIFLTALLFCVGIAAADASTRCGETLDYSFDTRLGVLTIYGTGKMDDWTEADAPWLNLQRGQTLRQVVIADGVSSIGDNAFSGCDTLEKVTIADSVTSIGEGAFENCEKLTSVTLPRELRRIGFGAFFSCRSAKFNALPQNLVTIDTVAFYGCEKLTELEIPASVTTIGYGCFASCSNLRVITVADGNENFTVENGVLYNRDKTLLLQAPGALAEKVIIPDSVAVIGNNAFDGCYRLPEVTIPTGVQRIGTYAFNGCEGLRKVTVPSTVTEIGNSTFAYCTFLEKIFVDADNQVYADVDGALYSKDGTHFLQLPGAFPGDFVMADGVTEIAPYAFAGCSRMRSVTLPDSVQTLGSNTFKGCTSLSDVEIPAAVKGIPTRAFWGCTGLSQMTIPKGITSIGGGAFAQCTVLKQVNFEEGTSLTSIGSGAFHACKSLTHMDLPESVRFIDELAFDECTALTSVTLPRGLTSIPFACFYRCEKLQSIRIPASVTEIGNIAFYTCTELEEVTIPKAVQTIGDFAFYKCGNLSNVIIENDAVSIGAYAFYACSKRLTLHGEMNGNIKQYAESHDYNFKERYVKQQVVTGTCGEDLRYTLDTTSGVLTVSGRGSMQNWSMAASPWSYSADIRTVLLNDGVTSIGSFAFEGCNNLTAVTLPNSMTRIGAHAFTGCTGLQTVNIPKTVVEIGEQAFSKCRDTLTLRGAADGIAAAYAEKNGIRFSPINSISDVFQLKRTYPDAFTDVPKTAWFYTYVKTAYEYALANGTSTKQFSPNGKFTVAQALTAAANIHVAYTGGSIDTAGAANWYDPYVSYCVANGIVKAGQFADYNKNITRGDMAVVFASILPAEAYTAVRDGACPDVTDAMPCAAAVQKLYRAGIVGGDAGTGNYRPSDEIARSEACVIFTRIAAEQFRIGTAK